jgi:hypothetical protein
VVGEHVESHALTRRRGVFARIERVLLGIVFGMIAFVIERRVLKAIKRKEDEGSVKTEVSRR